MSSALAQTLIVMPAYNEEDVVADVVTEVFDKLPGVTVLVVNDGSRDDTVARARSAGATVLDLPFNLGVGGAMRTGFKYAQQHGFRYVVQVDSDGQHDPSGVPLILDALASVDVAIGARFAGEGDYQVTGPRRWAMVVLAAVIGRIARTKLTDTTSGFRGAGPRAIEIFAQHYPAEYLGDTVESLVLAARAGCSITQVPVSMRPRAGGTPSHNPVKAAVYLGRAGLALIIALWRPPLALSVEAPTT
ncbi:MULTISPECIES: glycosyltransferase family 2 protein [Frigoribacterium]|jgi:glycosyltransferase involved in cell wall biosynthesis|uniref:glycosyltransferase family 2 protein n=1 Tax=Frigoribacterium TaxID=96492 RepID=UPI0012F28FB2|nr:MULTISPECIES: glycosyltransferase family 2 protein [Frigoribacterium]NQW86492.1 glycosyltransferase family 2 protein [Frigoribacterium sp. VKM Ac-2860]NQX07824.1 glycosyltransferase family 2 protein [Frigoribacterium sp. VKM Ac-2859]VXC20776.1 Glycosyl transferase family 2 [Frigoribacterium sp. 9N]